jgi:hypothetical protein
MIRIETEKLHPLNIHFNNCNNEGGEDNMYFCIFDDDKNTEVGTKIFHFPVETSKFYRIDGDNPNYKEVVFISIGRIAPLLFSVLKISYLKYTAEKITAVKIQNSEKDLFQKVYENEKTAFEQGEVRMVNSTENVNYMAQLVHRKDKREVNKSAFSKVLQRYMETFIIKDTNALEATEEFIDFYKSLKFL